MAKQYIAVLFCRARFNGPWWRRGLTLLAMMAHGTRRIHVALGSTLDRTVLDLTPYGDYVWPMDLFCDTHDYRVVYVPIDGDFNPEEWARPRVPLWISDMWAMTKRYFTCGRRGLNSPDCVHHAVQILRGYGVRVPTEVVTAAELEEWIRAQRQQAAGQGARACRTTRRDVSCAHAA